MTLTQPPRFLVFCCLTILSLGLSSCSHSEGSGQVEVSEGFALSVSDLMLSDLNYFKKQFKHSESLDGLDSYQWDNTGLITNVLAEGIDTPILQVNCAYMLGDLSALGGVTGIAAIVSELNSEDDAVDPARFVEDLSQLVETGIGSVLTVGTAQLKLQGIQGLEGDRRLIVLHITPIGSPGS